MSVILDFPPRAPCLHTFMSENVGTVFAPDWKIFGVCTGCGIPPQDVDLDEESDVVADAEMCQIEDLEFDAPHRISPGFPYE